MADSDINKTSIAGTISSFVDNLEKWVLEPEEALNDSPSSFVGLLTSTLGKISGYSFFNMMMAKREINSSTAILTKSLLRQLKSDDISGIYGTPASIEVCVAYPQDEIIRNSVLTDGGVYKLTLNKNTTFNVSDYPSFTLDYNIDIYMNVYTSSTGEENYSFYAMYDVSDVEAGDIISISNPYITSRDDIVINDSNYFTMYITAKQLIRETVEKQMSGEAKTITIDYSNNLVGFVVLYKAQSSSDFIKVNTYLEGESFADGVAYTLTNNGGSKTIRLRFSKIPGAFNPSNGIIKVIVYTCSGTDGNFSIQSKTQEMVENEFSITIAQNISDRYQEAMISMVPSIYLIGNESVGGQNQKDIEEIRSLVADSNRGEVITPATITTKASSYGFSAYKRRHDLLSFEYLLSSFLKDSTDNSIITSKMINGYFLFSDIPLDTESNSRMITPSDTFTYDKDQDLYKHATSESSENYSKYYYTIKKDYTQEQYSFPFFIRVNDGDSAAVTIWDESVNKLVNTQFVYLNDVILDKASITSVLFSRNPTDMSTIETWDDHSGYAKDFYLISFEVNVETYIYDHLQSLNDGEDPYVKFRLYFHNKNDNSVYAKDVEIEDCEFQDNNVILCKAYLETTSYILDTGYINICNNSIKLIPFNNSTYSFYYIDSNLDVDIGIIFKSSSDSNIVNNEKYDIYLTDYELENNYYMGIIYRAADVYLAKELTDYINIVADLKLTQPTYEYAEEDIPDVYDNIVYKMDGDIPEQQTVSVTLPNGNVVTNTEFIVLHNVGDVKRANTGKVATYGTTTATWSNENGDEGIFNDGSVLGYEAIYSIVEWNGLVIFGGAGGRVGCYDITYDTWHPYNENSTNQFRNNDESKGKIIKNSGVLGTYTDEKGITKYADIRGMKLMYYNTYPVLIIWGDAGRVVSCNLTNNVWRKYDGSGGDSNVAIFYNNGYAIGDVTIYCAESYSYSIISTDGTKSEKTGIIFAGTDGRVCSLNFTDGNTWNRYSLNSNNLSKSVIFSQGSEREYKTILSMSKYLENMMFLTGIDGYTSIIDLTTGAISILDAGTTVNKTTMYSSLVYGSLYVEAGRNGIVASFDIIHYMWNNYSSNSSVSSNGSHIGNVNINDIITYGTNILFCGDDGHIATFELTANTWENYDSGSKLTSTGSFIENSIECVSYNSEEGDTNIWFGGKNGNITYKYYKGDLIYDVYGKPKIKNNSEQMCYIKGIPAFSRLFNVPSKYYDVNDSYNSLIEKLKVMNNVFIDTGKLYLGLKTTSGTSTTYYYVDKDTGEEVYLDSLNLSFKIGVKFEDNITDENAEFLISNIKEYIVDYVNGIQESTVNSSGIIEFNIIKMLESIKENIPSINYFEFYGINNYSAEKVQTIFYKPKSDTSGSENEYISVQMTIDESESNISEGDIVFIPNITITSL